MTFDLLLVANLAFFAGYCVSIVAHRATSKPEPQQVRVLTQHGPHVLLDLGNGLIMWQDITKPAEQPTQGEP